MEEGAGILWFLVVVFVIIPCQVAVLIWRILFRHPVRALLLTVFVGACLVTSPRLTVGVVTYTTLAIIAWWLVGVALARAGRLKVLAAYQLVIGRRLHARLRRWWLYDRRWQRVLASQHLTVPLERKLDDVPKLCAVRSTRWGDTLRVKVLPGQTVRDFAGMDGETANSLAKAFRARECKVTDRPQTDYLMLELPRGRDPLAETVPFPGIPASPADVDLRRVPIGEDEHGRRVTVPVLWSHCLLGGITDSGKSGVMWAILLHLIPLIEEGSVEVWLIDPKRLEFSQGRNLFKVFCKGDAKEIAGVLEDAIVAMDESADRLEAVGLRKLEPSPEHPLRLIVIDELGRLNDEKDCQSLIEKLVNIGRAAGVSLLGALQNPTKATMRSRDEWPVKVAMRLASRDYVKMLLGRAAYLAGARCDEIPMNMQGCGYTVVDEKADEFIKRLPWWARWLPWNRGGDVATARPPVRFRAYWVSDEDIAAANERMAPAPVEEPEPAAA